MVKTPERDKQTPEKERIAEETDTQEKTTIDLSDIPSEKKDTPRKETQGNDEDGDYLPTPPEDQEQNNQNDTQEEKEKDGDETKSTTSEQTEHTTMPAESGEDQKDVR